MIRIAVCDDSRIDIERMEAAFDQMKNFTIEYDVYFSAEELLEYRRRHEETYHLYFFDIEMPGMNGLELAREIRRSDSQALFVFLTSYAEYVMDVFDMITFQYITKPITAEKLESVLSKAVAYLNMTKRDFVFQFRKCQFRISCDDILYIEKKGRQAVIHTISENYKTNMTNEEIWEQLDEKNFAQSHVSFIVNLVHVKAIDRDEVIMDNQDQLLIARSQKQMLKDKHMNFLKGMV